MHVASQVKEAKVFTVVNLTYARLVGLRAPQGYPSDYMLNVRGRSKFELFLCITK